MPRKLIVANWKLNLPDIRVWRSFRPPWRNAEVVICPSFVHISRVMSQVPSIKRGRVKLGGQDCFWEERGAFTGEVSPGMLKKLGAEYVIVGHSERRNWLGETDEIINKKARVALKAGLKVILCVGEPRSARRQGLFAAKRFVANQLRKDLRGVGSVAGHKSLAIAYEPIWAIGTGRADKPEDSAEMAKFIKRVCASRFAIRDLPVLYGGSVTSKNAESFLSQKEIDGALVGGASLDVREFVKIIKTASKKI